ncbi:MAG: alpha/beta hydrolase [Phyllobacterium sp.]
MNTLVPNTIHTGWLSRPVSLCRRAFLGLLMAIGVMLAGASSSASNERGKLTLETFDLTARNGVTYRIFLASPGNAAASLPVVYFLDGNATFPVARDVLAENSDMQAVLVGIGYPTDDKAEIIRLRYTDLTPPTPAELIPTREGATAPQTGGRDAFLAFIIDELKPEIERRRNVDTSHQTLFGHSLGGHFALSALFRNVGGFQTFIAADPSIWWNGRSLLQEQSAYLNRTGERAAARLLIETAGVRVERPGTDKATADRLARLRSGPGGKDVAAELRDTPGLHVAYRGFPDESHGSLIAPSVRDALDFALRNRDPIP